MSEWVCMWARSGPRRLCRRLRDLRRGLALGRRIGEGERDRERERERDWDFDCITIL